MGGIAQDPGTEEALQLAGPHLCSLPNCQLLRHWPCLLPTLSLGGLSFFGLQVPGLNHVPLRYPHCPA